MKIGEAAAASGLTTKTIRYYEDEGLLPRPDRRESGYRDYGDADVERMVFLRRARDFGFSLKEMRELLGMLEDHHRRAGDVRALTVSHIERLDRQLAEMRSLRAQLAELTEACAGGDSHHCAILEVLAAGRVAQPTTQSAKRAKTERTPA